MQVSPATLKERFVAQARRDVMHASCHTLFCSFAARLSPLFAEAHPLVVRGQLEPGYVLAEFLGPP